MQMAVHMQKRPNRLQAEGALFVVCGRGSSSGQGRGAYITETPSSILAPRTIITSGTVSVAAATAPDLQPRDWAPEYPTVSNIAITARNCTGQSPNMLDWARHEHPSPRQAD